MFDGELISEPGGPISGGKPGDKGRRAAVHLVLGAVPGDAGEVGHVRVHQEHVPSLHYHTKAPASEKSIKIKQSLNHLTWVSLPS